MRTDGLDPAARAIVEDAERRYEEIMVQHRGTMRLLEQLERANRDGLRMAKAWLVTVVVCIVVGLGTLIWKTWPY